MLLRSLLTYDMLPWYHKILFNITNTAITVLAILLTIIVFILLVMFITTIVSDWLRNLRNFFN
jgi:hypothetical protein